MNFSFIMEEKLWLYIKTIDLFEQIYSYRTFIYNRKIMELWKKKLWHCNEKNGTTSKTVKLCFTMKKKLWYYGEKLWH